MTNNSKSKEVTPPVEATPEVPQETFAIPLTAKKAPGRFNGGYRTLKGVYPAVLLREWKKRDTATGAMKSVVSLIFFAEWVHGYSDLKQEVEVGKEIGQYWHDLQELEDQVAVERQERLQRELDREQRGLNASASTAGPTSGRSEATPATVSAS